MEHLPGDVQPPIPLGQTAAAGSWLLQSVDRRGRGAMVWAGGALWLRRVRQFIWNREEIIPW